VLAPHLLANIGKTDPPRSAAIAGRPPSRTRRGPDVNGAVEGVVNLSRDELLRRWVLALDFLGAGG
jgi:hypothetical protein